MKPVSILNEVLGPVMRGPSSSHTAGSFHIARIVADLFHPPGHPNAAAALRQAQGVVSPSNHALGTPPGHPNAGAALGTPPGHPNAGAALGTPQGGRSHGVMRARCTFDPRGSYAQVFRQQGVDRAFAVGLLGWALTDPRFFRVLELAPAEGLDLQFDVRPLGHADHPNTVEIELDSRTTETGAARPLRATARSVGGGSVEIISIDGWPVRLTGEAHEVLVETDLSSRASALEQLSGDGQLADEVYACEREGRLLLHARRYAALSTEARRALERLASDGRVREARPIAFVKRGRGLFGSAAEMIALAEASNVSLGRLALAHEASLLDRDQSEVLAEMLRRLDVMSAAVADGLREVDAPMQLLEPSARRVFEAEAAGRVAIGGPHTRAAARALAAMHVNSRMGVVCAAPTGGSAGVLPGVIVTLIDEGVGIRGQGSGGADPREAAALALFAAGAIGVVVAERATFAAEVAGCQVEIGAAGAMAAAAVVEAAGGTARQAADAAAIAFQNTMGSVCDLVQGIVEIPCHTRNAAAASNAFVCADLVLGGYRNPIPLDETVDAVFAVGRMLPAELRCTARGGLAATPSAVAMGKREGWPEGSE